MSTLTTISVVIPSIRPETTRKTLTYLLSTEVTPAEIIVVSDGYHDEFAKLCEEMGVKHVENEGKRQHHGRITGLKHVKTEFVHLLDDDDQLNPSFYKNLEKYLCKNMVGVCLPTICGYGRGAHLFTSHVRQCMYAISRVTYTLQSTF